MEELKGLSKVEKSVLKGPALMDQKLAEMTNAMMSATMSSFGAARKSSNPQGVLSCITNDSEEEVPAIVAYSNQKEALEFIDEIHD